MTVRVVRLGTPRASAEGLRIGTVRRPPRGVPASRFAPMRNPARCARSPASSRSGSPTPCWAAFRAVAEALLGATRRGR